jgi:hypothetical protein
MEAGLDFESFLTMLKVGFGGRTQHCRARASRQDRWEGLRGRGSVRGRGVLVSATPL